MSKKNSEDKKVENTKENNTLEKEDLEAGKTNHKRSGNDEDINSLKSKLENLKKKYEDSELRNLAKIQNINRIHKQELENAHKFSSKRFAEEMLQIKDYLEMALKDKSGNFDMLKMGVDMTLKQLINVFTKSNISEIDVKVGDPIDPNIHNIVSVVESKEKPNTVLEVQRKGYKFHDRVLRPAMVVVTKNSIDGLKDNISNNSEEDVDK